MTRNMSIHNPHRHSSTGELYVVRIRIGDGIVESPCWTAEEAGHIRDRALSAGYSARIISRPTTAASAGLPEAEASQLAIPA